MPAFIPPAFDTDSVGSELLADVWGNLDEQSKKAILDIVREASEGAVA